MSRLEYSVDLAWYNYKQGDAFFLEGWMIPPEGETTDLLIRDDQGRTIPMEIIWKERPDIKKARPELKVPDQPGFTIKIPQISTWLKQIKTLELKAETAGEDATVYIAKKNEISRIIADNTIIYQLEVKKNLEEQIILQGWYFDQRGVNQIRVVDQKNREIPCESFRTIREDVWSKYEDYIEKKQEIGFTIRIPKSEITTNQVRVQFLSVACSRDYVIDMKELAREGTQTGRLYNALRPGRFSENVTYIRNHGFTRFVDHVKKSVSPEYSNYTLWAKNHQITKGEMLRQREHVFAENPVISIVIPLYNTSEKYFKVLLDSIFAQTYGHWQLCLGDGSQDDHLKTYIQKHYGEDARICYKHLEKNGGIAGNTNQALALATGDYVMLCDHDDIVEPDALFEIAKAINENPRLDIIYTDEDKITMDGKTYFGPNFKPDFSPFMLESNNYICHIFVVRRKIIEAIGGFRREFDGAQDYDLILRCWENSSPECIHHIPKILYHWRSHPSSTANSPESKRYAYEAGERALQEHFKRIHVDASVEITPNYGIYRIYRKPQGTPKVSIIIPNKDHVEDLDKCLSSLENKTTYTNYEILVVENNSSQEATFSYYEEMEKKYSHCRLLKWEQEFNYAAINNYGVEHTDGEYLVFLNNDVELITDNWIEEFLGICQQPGVGAVGAKLYFPNETIQHSGVILGLGGIAGHIFTGISRYEPCYMGRGIMPHNLSAVTAACMMVPRKVYTEVGGFDEDFKVAFNDVDLCVQITRHGYQIVMNPYVELYHYESKSRGAEDTGDKQSRFYGEVFLFQQKWSGILDEGDPYYNINLSLADGNCNPKE